MGLLLMIAAVLVASATTTQSREILASVYGVNPSRERLSSRTANGERFNPRAMTAAHKTLPFGTRVHLRNRKTGRSATVRINDRGPYVRGRGIDLTPAAARALGCGGLCRLSAR